MNEEKPIIVATDEEQESDYLHVPPNKPRHIVFTDEAIGKLIKVARLIKFQIDSPENQEPMVTVVLKDPNGQGMNTFKGQGITLGHALREMLDNVNLVYPLGEE